MENQKKIQGSILLKYFFKRNRCHFVQKLYDEPEIEYQNLNKAYDGLRENNFNEKYFLAWNLIIK